MSNTEPPFMMSCWDSELLQQPMVKQTVSVSVFTSYKLSCHLQDAMSCSLVS